MILTFYDKDFKPISDNSSLNIGSWDLTNKAIDFDDFSCTSEPFLINVQPTFAVMMDDLGNYLYGCFAGVPELTIENQTKLTGSDLRTFLNNDIYCLYSNYGSKTLKDYFTDVINDFQSQINDDSISIDFDFTKCSAENIIISSGELQPSMTSYEIKNIWNDLLIPYLEYYDMFLSARIDLVNKKIVYSFVDIGGGFNNLQYLSIKIHADDYGILNLGKYSTSLNEAQAIVVSGTTSISESSYAILKKDNSIVVTSTPQNERELFPPKKKTILKTASSSSEVSGLMSEGIEEAVQALANARYNESISLVAGKDEIINNAGLSDVVSIYMKNGNVYNKYKDLPVGSIKTGKNKDKTMTIGYKSDDIVLYIK